MLVILALALVVGVERLSHALTDDFGYASITSNLPDDPRWDCPTRHEDHAELERALSQPYNYLESGSQSYAFVSQDGKYVIKFFKHKRWRLNPLIASLPLPPSLKARRDHWVRKKKETVASTFQSCITSYQEFREETGVIFVHLNKKGPFGQNLIVRDRIGFKHLIDLKEVEFILQRKAIPTHEYLLDLKNKGMDKEAEKAIRDLIAFTAYRAHKGYSDKDPHLIRNFGFIDGKATQIDIGGFHRDPKKDLRYFYSHELLKIRAKLIPWLVENYPELASSAEQSFSNQSLLVNPDQI